jgi:hypothetical protein
MGRLGGSAAAIGPVSDVRMDIGPDTATARPGGHHRGLDLGRAGGPGLGHGA